MRGLRPAETHEMGSLTQAQNVGSIIVPEIQVPRDEPLQDMTLSTEYFKLLKPILKKYNYYITNTFIESKYFPDKREYTLISNNIVNRFLLQIPHKVLSNPQQKNATQLAIIRDLFISNFERNIILIVFCDSPIQIHLLYKNLIKDWNATFQNINIKINCLRDILDLSGMKEKIKEETVEDIFVLKPLTESQKFLHTIRSQESQICGIEETLNNIKDLVDKIHLSPYSNIIIRKLLTEIFSIKFLVSQYEKIQKEIDECKTKQASPSSDITKSERELSKQLQDKIIVYGQVLLPNYEDIIEEVLRKAGKETQTRKKTVYNYDTVEEIGAYVNSLNEITNEALRAIS